MARDLLDAISAQTTLLITNSRICLRTFDPDAELFGLPLWKHAYHALHSLDRWYINPAVYEEPPFHIPGLNSLDEPSERKLTREELLAYLQGIETKIEQYLSGLTDELLSEKPDDCEHTRLSLVLGQFRHFYAHLGNINAMTMQSTGKWPLVLGLSKNAPPEEQLFE